MASKDPGKLGEDKAEDSATEASSDTVTEAQYEQRVGRDVEITSGELSHMAESRERSTARKKRLLSWDVAAEIVKSFRPVPWSVWRIIHPVFGRIDRLGQVSAMNFQPMDVLIIRAALDKTLGKEEQQEDDESKPRSSTANASLIKAIDVLGYDVATTCCYIHAVSRRLGRLLSERMWCPMLDDALLRAKIGYHLGLHCPEFGAGYGMLAGFSGRSGLAAMIATGRAEQGVRALEQMAMGGQMREVCNKIYGCDPLQVSALSLVASGCSRDVALGTASFGLETPEVQPGTYAYTWLAGFTIIEHLRMGTSEEVNPAYWSLFNLDDKQRKVMIEFVAKMQRKRHGWMWMTETQLVMEIQ